MKTLAQPSSALFGAEIKMAVMIGTGKN